MIAVLPGDGIGPEVTACAQRVLAAVRPDLAFEEFAVGAAAVAAHQTSLPDATLAGCERADAILFGAVGGTQFDGTSPQQRPEYALLTLRKHFDLYANVRPATMFAGLESRSPLRADLASQLDLIIVRELTGGLYFGEKIIETIAGIECARETMSYRAPDIERVVRFAFELARTRSKRLTSVDKVNVLVNSQLWRKIAIRVAADYPDVALDHLLVDNAAMQLVRDPGRFDVLVMENMFGDILSDEAAALGGSIGTAPSASVGTRPAPGGKFGLYEPIAGTAPDIAGRGIANPTAAILSAALLLRFSLGDEASARVIEDAVRATYAAGARTADLVSTGEASLSSSAFTDALTARLVPCYS
jgi:3-isopropylmalate dehydrogenase